MVRKANQWKNVKASSRIDGTEPMVVHGDDMIPCMFQRCHNHLCSAQVYDMLRSEHHFSQVSVIHVEPDSRSIYGRKAIHPESTEGL